MSSSAVYNSQVFNDYWNTIKGWSQEWKDALVDKIEKEKDEERRSRNFASWAKIYGSMTDFPTVSELEAYIDDKDKDIGQFVV